MYGWLIDAVNSFVASPWLPVVVLLVLIGGAFLPALPGGITLLTATAAAAPDVRQVTAVALAALCGAVIGDIVGHTLGRRFGTRVLAHPLLRRTRRPVLRARLTVRHHPTPILAGGRFLPGGRLVSVLATGISRVPLRRMLLVTVPVAVLWTGWMTFLGVLGNAVADENALGGPAAAWAISAVLTTVVITVGGLLARRRAVRNKRADSITAATPAETAAVVSG